jgi:hypothetical protein
MTNPKLVSLVITIALLASSAGQVSAGPALYGVCQTGCCSLAVACYSAAGATFGTVLAVAATPAILGCNTAFGICSAKCAAVTLPAPTL